MNNSIRISRIEIIQTLKNKFYGNEPSSWGTHSNQTLGDWYKEYILENKEVILDIY